MRVAIVGAGNLGAATANGLVAAGHDPRSIVVSHPKAARRDALGSRGFSTTASNADAVGQGEIAVLAVKPQVLPAVLPEIASAARGKLVVSIAAGTPLAAIAAAIPSSRVVRAMPNQPAAVRAGITALWAPASIAETDRRAVADLFDAVGATVWLPREELFHAVTALAASGPGFLFAIAEALADGGVAAGLPRGTALLLAAHAIAGSGRMLVESGEHPGVLKDRVASPGGTTIHGLAAMEKAGVRGGLIAAVRAAARRSVELAGGRARRTVTRKRGRG